MIRRATINNQTTLPYLQPGHLFYRPVALRPQVTLSLPLQDSLSSKTNTYRYRCQKVMDPIRSGTYIPNIDEALIHDRGRGILKQRPFCHIIIGWCSDCVSTPS